MTAADANYAVLDPEISAYVAALPPGTFDFDEWTLETVAARRAARAAQPLPDPPPTSTVFRDVRIDADVAVRIYTPPAATASRPCVFWIHGGGYLSGTALTIDARLNRWVEMLDCVVVSVDYRLAPEHPFPVPLEDCYTAMTWLFANAEALGVDPARVVLSGASAGGGLAAAVALLARDRVGPPLAHQVLLYPMLDDRRTTRSSGMNGTPVWGRPANALGWRAYLGTDDPEAEVHAYAAAARATDLAGLPPAFVAVGGADLFRDESLAYAARLLEADVATEVHVYPGGCHGFEVLVPKAALSRRFDADLSAALRGALHPTLPSLEGTAPS